MLAGSEHMSAALYVVDVPVATWSSALALSPYLHHSSAHNTAMHPNRTLGVVSVPVTYITAISSACPVNAMWPCFGVPSVSADGTVTDARATCVLLLASTLTYVNLPWSAGHYQTHDRHIVTAHVDKRWEVHGVGHTSISTALLPENGAATSPKMIYQQQTRHRLPHQHSDWPPS
jgi:hypothetical protein